MNTQDELQRISRRSLAMLWPNKMKGRRNYRSSVAQLLLSEERALLAERLRKRERDRLGHSQETAKLRRDAVKKIVRALRRSPGQKRSAPLSKVLLIGRLRPNAIVDALVPDRAKRWVPPQRRKVKYYEITLENFSLITNPYDTFLNLQAIALQEATGLELAVHFTDGICFDVSAYLVLGLMRENMLPVFVGGRISSTIRSMVKAVDLNRFLHIAGLKHERTDPSFLAFPLRQGRGNVDSSNVAFQPSSMEKLADDLNEKINDWLRMLRKPELGIEGKAYVARLVTEALDNAQRHSDLSSSHGNWAIAAFMAAAEERNNAGTVVSYVCSLAIVSLGATISESISVAGETVRKKIDSYVSLHKRKTTSGPSVDVLKTVYALQDGVSRFPQGHDDSKGGVGLMDIIEFVRGLSSDSVSALEFSCVTIISGNACLSVRASHADAAKAHPSGRREIWFNSENSLVKPPDPKYAFPLPCRFPGTIVALRFCLSQELKA